MGPREAVAYVAPLPGPHHQRPEGDELTIDFREVLQIWLRRWRSAVAVGLVAAAATALFAFHRQPVYSATAMTVVETGRREIVPLSSNQDTAPSVDAAIIDTRVMMASSGALAERVIKGANLMQDPEFAHPDKLGGRPSMASVASAVRANLLVRRVGLTSAIQMTFRSHDPVKAAAIANAFADEFVDWEVDTKVGANQKSNQFINEHLQSLQREAEAAETAVQQYKIAHNLMSAAGQTLAEQQVGTLSEQIAVAEADLAEKQARLNAANDQASRGGANQDIAATLSSTTISQLRSQEADASRRLADLKAHYGPRYPDVQKAESQLSEIQSKIQDEANRIHSSLASDVNAAAQRLRSLRSSQYSAQGSLASNNRAEVGLVELERRAEASRQLYDAFLNRSKETSVSGAEQPDARVFDRATVPLVPSSPNPRIVLLLSAAAALLGAAATIAILEVLDTSIRSSDDIGKRFGLPVLGIIPTPRSSENRERKLRNLPPEAYLVKRPFSVFAESFRKIRAALIVPDQYGRRRQVVAIASALPKEGKSTSAFCLMRTIAMSGASVVLVDCDLRRRGVSSFIPANERGGLVEVLQGRMSVSDALVHDQETPGWVLPILGSQDDQIDLFTSPEMEQLIADLRERFDIVLLDTPATLAIADASILVAKADAVLFVVQWAKTPAKAVEVGLETLISAHANIIGVVLSLVDLKRQARTSYQDGASYYRRYASYYQN
jgi:capsular exopolysaccharide synthesis family protein